MRTCTQICIDATLYVILIFILIIMLILNLILVLIFMLNLAGSATHNHTNIRSGLDDKIGVGLQPSVAALRYEFTHVRMYIRLFAFVCLYVCLYIIRCTHVKVGAFARMWFLKYMCIPKHYRSSNNIWK